MTDMPNLQPLSASDAVRTARMSATVEALGLAATKHKPTEGHQRRRAPEELRDHIRSKVTQAMRRVTAACVPQHVASPDFAFIPLVASKDTITIEENGRFFYRRVTHIAELDGVRLFAFVFARNGAIEAYRDFEGNDEWTSLGSRMGHTRRQCDPMLCLVYQETLVAIYNIPTVELLEGTRAERLPFVAPTGDAAVAEGHIAAVGFATDASEETYKILTQSPEMRYAVALTSDANSGAPAIAVYHRGAISSGRRGRRSLAGPIPEGLAVSALGKTSAGTFSAPSAAAGVLASDAYRDDVELLNTELAPKI